MQPATLPKTIAADTRRGRRTMGKRWGHVLPFQSMSTNLEWQTIDPRFPIRPYASPGNVAAAERIDAIATLERALLAICAMPSKGWTTASSTRPIGEGGSALRQVVHHVADSHMNAFIRLRKALTEDWPLISPYDEKGWALLVDSSTAPVGLSLDIIEGLHARWVGTSGVADRGRLAARLQAPADGPDDGGRGDAVVCVALAPPCGAYHAPAQEEGLEVKEKGPEAWIAAQSLLDFAAHDKVWNPVR